MEYLHPFYKMPNKILAILISNLFCLVTSGSVSTQQVRIYPWNFTNFSGTELNLSLGDNLQLTCELPNVNYKFSLEWHLPHAQGRDVNKTEEKGRSILRVNNVSIADVGPYKCVPQFGENQDWPEVKIAQLMLYVKSPSECNIGFFQCHNIKHHCIANRFVCDGVKDCNDGSDETPEQCGSEDWCSGRFRCGVEGRCMDPRHCCDPQEDSNCHFITDCCEQYIKLKRYYFQIGIEQSSNVTKTKHHLFVIVGCIAAFTCILLVVIILMCQFPAEKPCLRPPNFLTRGSHHRRGRNFQPRVPVTMEDLDVYFESLRSVSHSEDHQIRMPLHPPPYSLNEPPPPYPGDPDPIPVPNPLNNNEDNNNGDINGNSDLRDQHSERVVAVLRLSPPLRRTMRGGSSLVALNQHRGGQQPLQQLQPLRGSRSVAALLTSPTHSRSGRGHHHNHLGGGARGGLQYPPSSGSSSSLTD